MTTPTAQPVEPLIVSTTALASLDTSALTSASLSAETLTAAAACARELTIAARACAGFWLPKALEISGSPSSASTALKMKFCEFQPIELKASVTATVLPSLDVAFSVRASIWAMLYASTSRLPSSVTTSASSIRASALPRTTFVAMTPLTAIESPSPVNVLPPEDVAELSAVARMTAASRADTTTLPATTVARRIVACTSLRTSLRTTRPPIAIESDSSTLTPVGSSDVIGSCFQ